MLSICEFEISPKLKFSNMYIFSTFHPRGKSVSRKLSKSLFLDFSNFKKWGKIVFAKPKNTLFLQSGKMTLATPLKNPILPDTSDLSFIGFLAFYRMLFVGLARHRFNFEKKYRGFYY